MFEGNHEYEGYDVALVCENGHEVNSASVTAPEHNAKHCQKCGAKALDACDTCSAKIRGYFHSPHYADLTAYRPPAFCHDCGKPYPWTSSAIDAAKELIELNEQLTDEEKADFKDALGEANRDSPKAKVASEKIKHYAKKLGVETMKTLREILTDVASETLKKSIGL